MQTAEHPDILARKPTIAVIGTGLVGSGWGIVFAKAGHPVRLFDSMPGASERALEVIGDRLAGLAEQGLVNSPEAIFRNVSVALSLEEVVEKAAYVQESVLEEVEAKSKLVQALEHCLPPAAVVGSSSSGIPASAFTERSAIRSRILVVHPVNPPYLIPVVELVPAPWTDSSAVEFAAELMTSVGQSPVRLRKEVQGFVLNRLQGALLREAWALFNDGVASVEDIDKTVRDGLGYRWSFMGPFETIDLNAPGGIADYARRLGPLYQAIDASRAHDEPWSDTLISRVESERRSVLPVKQLADRTAFRDRKLMALSAGRARSG
ncbi:MAG: 3-hydroxyacyl-CoA dehydrogenase [Verrucomicrobia bacterium]|nr:3-hydroxyacyl-CoA dehydrogenase [Verrucomicrobiota bacterium]